MIPRPGGVSLTHMARRVAGAIAVVMASLSVASCGGAGAIHRLTEAETTTSTTTTVADDVGFGMELVDEVLYIVQTVIEYEDVWAYHVTRWADAMAAEDYGAALVAQSEARRTLIWFTAAQMAGISAGVSPESEEVLMPLFHYLEDRMTKMLAVFDAALVDPESEETVELLLDFNDWISPEKALAAYEAVLTHPKMVAGLAERGVDKSEILSWFDK